jgi:hypothetical protein
VPALALVRFAPLKRVRDRLGSPEEDQAELEAGERADFFAERRQGQLRQALGVLHQLNSSASPIENAADREREK